MNRRWVIFFSATTIAVGCTSSHPAADTAGRAGDGHGSDSGNGHGDAGQGPGAADARAGDRDAADLDGGDLGRNGDPGSATDLELQPWRPVVCAASPSPPCASAAHDLPIPTHYSAAATGYSFLGADQASLFASPGLPADYAMGGCYPAYNHGIVPAADAYPADRYSGLAISDDEARAWASALCARTGMPVRHVFPPRPDGVPAAQPVARACTTQVVHAQLAGSSLFTVILPPGWDDAAPVGTYPILFNGHYDLNTNVFRELGARFVELVGGSTQGGGRGLIAVLWNGGGAYASRTMTPLSLDLFAEVIAEVAARYRGNPRWIVTTGGSRGGVTALRMAANPRRHPYRVVASVALVPPTLIGDHAGLASLTYPALLHAVGWSTGFQDAWRWGWTYPACAGRPSLTGLSAARAHLAVLTGSSDPGVVNAEHSLLGAPYLDGLAAQRTQIYLSIGEHDYIVPYAHQVRFGLALVQRALPAQIEVLVRGGHASIRTRLGGASAPYELHERVLTDIVAALTDPRLDLDGAVPALVAPGVRYHRVNRQTGEAETFTPTAGYPFSADLPYYAIAGQSFPIVVVGEPGTSYSLSAVYEPNGALAGTFSGVISQTMTETTVVDLPPDQPLGRYTWSAILTRGDGAVATVPATATTTGAPCTTEVIASEPPLDYQSAATAAQPPTLPAYTGTNWGLSEY